MKNILLIFIILLSSNLYSQSEEYPDDIIVFDVTINENLHDYFVEIIVRYTSGRFWDPSTISIISKDLTDTLSRVDQGTWKNFSSEKEDYKFVDINFDGYKDLMVHQGYSANGVNEFYEICIFNPKTNELVWDQDLSELIGVNTTIDSVMQQVETYAFDPRSGESESCTYEYKNGKWIRLR